MNIEITSKSLLIHLPCNVGDTVYYISAIDKVVVTAVVTMITITPTDVMGLNQIHIRLDTGKTSFSINSDLFGVIAFTEKDKAEQMRTELRTGGIKMRVCGNCKYNTIEDEEFCCNNESSDNYGCFTAYDDSCEDWEE